MTTVQASTSTLRSSAPRVSEVARSRPFLTGTILFSSISPTYEKNLKDELFACFKYVGIPFEMLNKMPIADRKYYIHKYNEYMEARNAAMQGDYGSSSTDISSFTDMSQGIVGNGL